MKTPLKLVTIVSERTLKDELIRLLKRAGASGFTETRAEGEGSRGRRTAEWAGPNVKLETLVSERVAEAILNELAAEYFENYSIVTWVTDVMVLRGEKFLGREGGA